VPFSITTSFWLSVRWSISIVSTFSSDSVAFISSVSSSGSIVSFNSSSDSVTFISPVSPSVFTVSFSSSSPVPTGSSDWFSAILHPLKIIKQLFFYPYFSPFMFLCYFI